MSRKSWRETFRFSLSLQMVGMVLLLVLSSMLLISVYAGSIRSVKHSSHLYDGIMLARNIAEMYTADPDLDKVREYAAGSTSEGSLQADLSETVAGSLHTLNIRIFSGEEEIYQLGVDVCDQTAEGGGN